MDNSTDTPMLTIHQGTLRGKKVTSVLTKAEFYSFLGIPYATPPLDNLRFQSPKPAEKWTDVLDATEDGKPCLQANRRNTSRIFGDEDCLYLNVHIPQMPDEAAPLKAVMVYIHGGAFSNNSGTTDKFSADYLINHDVVVVTINYRLHVFGFLNLGVYECPGNVGLKDQLLALKWVKKNIKFFGGDPNNVTLFGQSSGAKSIYLHILSPLSRGLFTKCILHSAVKPRFILNNAPATAAAFAKHLGCDSTDTNELLGFFRKLSGKDLTKGFVSFTADLRKTYFPAAFVMQPFGPSEESVNTNAFLPASLTELVKKAPALPIIHGMTSKEGSFSFLANSIQETINFIKTDMKFYLPPAIASKEAAVARVIEEVKKFYFNDRAMNETILPEIVDFYSDSLFNDFYDYNGLLPKSFYENRIYNYEFDYDGEFDHYKKKYLGERYSKVIEGSAHTDDMCYLFFLKKYYSDTVFTDEDRRVIRNICTLWTNFAKTGNPNSEDTPIGWKPITWQSKQHLKIGKQLEIVDGRIHEERYQFWDKMFQKVFFNTG